MLERLPKSSDRDAYLEQRREERGRPARQQQMRRLRSLNGNIKNDWEDETPEWMEGDEYSDYHTMVCYTFPHQIGLLLTPLEDDSLWAEVPCQEDRATGIHEGLTSQCRMEQTKRQGRQSASASGIFW